MVRINRAFRWWFPATVLILTLGIVTPFQSLVVQAQEGGTRTEAVYYLDYRITPRTRLCLGQTLWVEAEVKLRPEFESERYYNGLPVSPLQQNITATAVNVQVLAPGEPIRAIESLRSQFSFNAIRAGTTSIEIAATAQNPSNPPIPPEFRYHRSVRIDVIPCQIHIDANALWVTTVSEANAVFRTEFHTVLSLDENETSASGEGYLAVYQRQTAIQWDIAVNRFRGCAPGHNTSTPVPGLNDVSIRADIVDPTDFIGADFINLSLEFSPQSGVHITETGCDGNVITMAPLPRDWVYRDNTPLDRTSWFGWGGRTFSVENKDDIRVPLTGGTVSVPLTLTTDRPGGGTITIMVTPAETSP